MREVMLPFRNEPYKNKINNFDSDRIFGQSSCLPENALFVSTAMH